MINKKIIGLICVAATTLVMCSAVSAFAGEDKSAKGSYDIAVTGYDWGPSVNRTTITLDKEISEVSKDIFKVVESKAWYAGNQDFDRVVTNAYLSNDKGEKVEGVSKSITLELAVSPNDGSPFLYSFKTGRNNWTTSYRLNISLKEGTSLKAGEETITNLNINKDYTNKTLGSADKFKEKTYSKDGDISMKYAYYEPQEDGVKNPLIIWLHGAGEGGSDATIDILGNKVTALVEDKIQSKFNGAYVLAPQSPTMWMDSTGNATYTKDGNAIYATSLMNLIKSYVDSNDDIDTDRIYIGGCSNGGYMTMSMLLDNPEYFAAAYPICEAYEDSWISNERLEKIKDIPMWFTYAKNDGTVNPELNSKATVERLRKLGSKDLKTSVFDKVVDTSGLYKDDKGNPYEYNGHWSWIYAFNDECYDGTDNLWTWLASQKKESKASDVVNNGVTDGDKQGNVNNNVADTDVTNNEINSNTNKATKTNDGIPKTGDVATVGGSILAALASAGAAVKFRKR